MKTVITSLGNNLEASFDLRFGRAKWFCVIDNSEKESVKFIENKYINDDGGVGPKVAEMLIEIGVTRIISGDFGPKAKDLLDKFKVQLVILKDEGNSINDIINKLKN